MTALRPYGQIIGGFLALVVAFSIGTQFRTADEAAIMRNRALSQDTNRMVKVIDDRQLQVLAYISAANKRGVENAERISVMERLVRKGCAK
jgi:hypothetical protein